MKKTIKLITVIGTASLLLTSCQITVKTPTYTITWQNYDGTVLEIDENVEQGTLPTFDGANPERAQTDEFLYVWTGWTPVISEASADVTYVATYREETRIYKITWNNYDGQTLKTEEVAYGVVPEYKGEEPTKEQTVAHTYAFDGWSPKVEAVTGNATYTASFAEKLRKYEITWKDYDGTVLKSEEVEFGKTPAYNGDDPIKENTIDQAFSFNGWSPNIAPVSGDTVYTATYRSEVRRYDITWKNYDGVVLKVDNLPYGATPSYHGVDPVKKVRGLESTFSGWSPEISQVTGDAEYVAEYSDTAVFSFEPVNYEMNDGYKLSDINGAPWINANVRGEIEKIKQPSLQDDFYTAVNYNAIKNGNNGAFGDSDSLVNESFKKIYNGEASSITTNGAVIKTTYDKISSGDVSKISSYLSGINVETYLTSKESFFGNDALLTIAKYGSGYEVKYNDGYISCLENGDYTYLGFLWSFSDTAANAKSIVSMLSSRYGLNLSSTDIDNIQSQESSFVNQAWYDYQTTHSASITYTVNTLPWAQMKSALLDLGVSVGDRITVKRAYQNCLNTIYNDLYTNNESLLRNIIISRLAYDCRFFVGTSYYKQINQYISKMPLYFGDEAYLCWDTDSNVNKKLALICYPNLAEQTYIELAGSEEIKAEVSSLIDDVLAAYRELADASWLESTTKTRMKKKLSYMKYGSCYSDVYKNIAKIGGNDLSSKTPFEVFGLYSAAVVGEKMRGNIDSTGYFNVMHSWTVNAYYSPGDNAFVILNGVVGGLLGKSIEEKYGMLAVVIGHEITHAFDSSGSQYDENGDYSNWWSSTDRVVFNQKVNKLKSFWNQISLKKNYYANGDTIDGEATADLGGMKVALMLAKGVENFDYDKFFRAYAYLWLSNRMSINDVQERAKDSHPFNYLRVNVTVSQFDEFVDTYGVKPGDGMYVPEEQRIKVW